MRTLPTEISAELTTQGAQPGYLVQIDTGIGTQYLCSLDVDFYYNSQTWVSSDITISGLSWNNGPSGKIKLVIGDHSLAWWAMAANYVLQDSVVSIWAVYAAAEAVAEPLWTGRIGAIKKGEMSLDCELVTDNSLRASPRRRVQSLIPAKYLIAPGTEIQSGVTKWRLERKR